LHHQTNEKVKAERLKVDKQKAKKQKNKNHQFVSILSLYTEKRALSRAFLFLMLECYL
jgi:hypothetical protein